MSHTLRGYALVLVGAALWASLGLFYKRLVDGYGLSPATVAFFRALLTALILFAAQAVLAAQRRQRLFPTVTTRRHLGTLMIFGLVGIAAFYVIYANAIDLAGVGVAAVLMYTAPAWVTVISAFVLDEPLTRRKAAAVALAFAGAALVARAYELEALRLNPLGTLFGLGAGLTYGLYTLFSKLELRRHSPWTVLTFGLAFGALFMLPVQDMGAVAHAVRTPEIVLWLLAMALGPTLLGGVSFNMGLRAVPASNASIIATLEPVMATLLGWLLLGERLEWPQLLGGALILGAVLLLSRARAESGNSCKNGL
ncbi:MAG: EamA family transporter [Anaerolineae bacterium]|nr:EamA family transporter [Anaerolineae bacterium]